MVRILDMSNSRETRQSFMAWASLHAFGTSAEASVSASLWFQQARRPVFQLKGTRQNSVLNDGHDFESRHARPKRTELYKRPMNSMAPSVSPNIYPPWLALLWLNCQPRPCPLLESRLAS